MGHDVIGMEQYVAEGMTPLARSLADVRSADAYLVIVGWRYGYVPSDANPQRRSITELEYEAALGAKTPILAFLLDPETPWPPSASDVFTDAGGDEVMRFRSRIGTDHLAGIFTTPDNLASQAAAAVATLGMTQEMGRRALGKTDITPLMAPFVEGADLVDTTVLAIRNMVADAGGARAVLINLGAGNTWWSTRLYLLATLLDGLTGIRQLVFTHADGSFAGMASPSAVRDGIGAAFPAIANFDANLRRGPASDDVQRETDRTINLWNAEMAATEVGLKVGVRWQLLEQWLGERLITRPVKVEQETGFTPQHAQQIVESPLRDVPVEQQQPQAPDVAAPAGAPVQPFTIDVVDRDAFGVELARAWVRTAVASPRVRR
jgi:hypothetical protein